MMKKVLCLLAALSLFAAFPAAAEDAVQPVTAEELSALAESVRTEALASQPLNDPTGENSLSEDGTLFQYEIARIYADGTALSADTPVNAASPPSSKKESRLTASTRHVSGRFLP